MDSNTCSTGRPVGLTALATAVEELAAQDPDGLADAALAEQVLELRRLLDRLEGQWLRTLAVADGRGAAGADQGIQAPSTAGWLRARLRLGASDASSAVRTARALYRGPLTQTAKALADGELSAAHASVLAHGTHDLPAATAAETEPVLVAAARRLDPPRRRRAVTHLRDVADPQGADQPGRAAPWPTGVVAGPDPWEGMVALQGLLEPEAGQILLAALEPLARPHNGDDPSQR
jgi:Domain of unknown function (DUF222)